MSRDNVPRIWKGMKRIPRIKVNGTWITVSEDTADNILDAYGDCVEAWEVE